MTDFNFGDKVTFWFSVAPGAHRYCTHLVVIGHGEKPDNDLLRCAEKNGGVRMIHPRLLEAGWNDTPTGEPKMLDTHSKQE